MAKPLTPITVKNAKPGSERREVRDFGCQGLYLIIQPSGAKSWAYRYRFAGKPKKLTIGPVYLSDGKGDEPEHAELDQPNTLSGARELAGAAARQVAKGIDPAGHKFRERRASQLRAENAELLDRDTVEAVARLFIERYAKSQTKSWDQTARLIGLKADPEDDSKLVKTETGGEVLSQWGARTVHEITRRDVHALLDGIVARGAPVTANRVLAAIRKMFNWAVERDILQASPCTAVKPPTAETSRDRVLTDDELRLVWRAATAIGWPFGQMVQELILTLQRRKEVSDMSRRELKKDRSWIIPKERAKNGIEHEVPLSDAAWTLIEGMPKIGKAGFVFSVTGEAPITGFGWAKERMDTEILKIQRADAVQRGKDPEEVEPLPHWTFHDLRRTGASGMARLGIQLPVIEHILNHHASGSLRGVTGIYIRHEFAEEKRKAMEAWASFVQSIVSGKKPDNVFPMTRAAR
ncbi:site-specific integrase [Bradyrhizobium sp. Mp64]|uniref:tyrosine-type recombinase/integrase n=1 Tax=Bradyrhizobium sp. Mp64 TaxID=3042158 RepID=UPI00248BE81A|nr:site-specific integrase [Bradyrhizobium sp. Mp64]MDI2103927.1 integrase arm-type DNA-binding domain-containing protein [Bradyrhizobium sp. Mp64]